MQYNDIVSVLYDPFSLSLPKGKGSLKGDSRAFYEFLKFAIFVLLLMPTVWKKYSKMFSRFSFHCNPREKHSDN